MRVTHHEPEERSLRERHGFLTMLGQQLDAFSTKDVWALLIASIAIIALLDFRLHPYLILGPLYMLPMCLACWRLGPQVGFATAFLAAALPLAAGIINGHKPPLAGGAANLVLQTVVFGFVAAIVSSFRYTYDREAALSKCDRMTGALNKQAFFARAETMLDGARFENKPLLLLFADLDGFKTINDENGHSVGDALLQSFAAELANATRKSDAFSRIGGDEFAALLRAETVPEATRLAETIHLRLSQILAKGPYPVTCSMGALIAMPDDRVCFSTLMHEADQLMYEVKRTGKNGIRISVADRIALQETVASPPTAVESDQSSLVT